MSQSPLSRQRRPLTAFAPPRSQLSKSTTSKNLQESENFPSTSTNNSPIPNTYITPTKSLSTPNGKHRTTGTGTPSTPILYSPYATSTPPAQLSRSSSIPFDMAGSIRAGKKAEEEANRRATLGRDGAMTPGERRKRLIRKKSFFQRAIDFPSNIIDKTLLLIPNTTQDLLPPENYAIPIVLAIQTLHFLLLAPLFRSNGDDRPESILRTKIEKSGVGSRWDQWEREGGGRSYGLGGGWSTSLFTLLLIFLASANTLYLFTRFRTYDMQLRTAQDPVPSPHASPIPAPKPTDSQDPFITPSSESPTESTGRKVAKLSWKVIVFLFRFSRSAIFAALGRPVETAPRTLNGEDKIQALHVWEPPEFCLAFFCAYPPSSPLLSHLLTPLHPFLTPPILFFQSLFLTHLAQSYAQLVKDRMVLSAEVMREYDRRFVYKRVFGTRVDRGVGTHEAETVW